MERSSESRRIETRWIACNFLISMRSLPINSTIKYYALFWSTSTKWISRSALKNPNASSRLSNSTSSLIPLLAIWVPCEIAFIYKEKSLFSRGFGHLDVAAVFLPNCIEYGVLMIGIWRCGGIFTGVSFASTHCRFIFISLQANKNHTLHEIEWIG